MSDALEHNDLEENDSLLRALIQMGSPPPSPRPEAPGIPQLVHYLSGAMDRTEAHQIELALTRYAQARSQLIPALQCLDALREKPWEEVARIAGQKDLMGQVASAWSLLVRQEAAAPPSESLAQRSWKILQEQRLAGKTGAQRLWNRLVTFADQIRAEQYAFRVAYTQGGEEQIALSGAAPQGARIRLISAEINVEGGLTAKMDIRASSEALTRLQGVPVWLCLESGGFIWPVEMQEYQGSSLLWNVPEIGTVLMKTQSSLAPTQLRLHFGSLHTLPVPDAYTFYAEVEPEEEFADASRTVPIRLGNRSADRARIEKDSLVLTLAMHPADQYEYKNHRLCLTLVSGMNLHQELGSWPMSDWQAETQTFRLFCPNFSEEMLINPELLRFRLALP